MTNPLEHKTSTPRRQDNIRNEKIRTILIHMPAKEIAILMLPTNLGMQRSFVARPGSLHGSSPTTSSDGKDFLDLKLRQWCYCSASVVTYRDCLQILCLPVATAPDAHVSTTSPG